MVRTRSALFASLQSSSALSKHSRRKRAALSPSFRLLWRNRHAPHGTTHLRGRMAQWEAAGASDRRERRVSRVGWSWQCLAAWLMLLRQADASQGGLQSKHERSQASSPDVKRDETRSVRAGDAAGSNPSEWPLGSLGWWLSTQAHAAIDLLQSGGLQLDEGGVIFADAAHLTSGIVNVRW